MTIANQLTALNNAKQAIKTAIEAKGQVVGDAPLSGYAAKIDAITTGGGTPIQLMQPTPWVRPADWLTLPTVAFNTSGCYILAAVFDTGSAVSFSVQGAYTVDWGDGVVQNFASGATATHSYDYNTIPADTWCSRGYRQVVIAITPQGSSTSLYNFNLSTGAPAGSNTTIQPRSVYLDVNMGVGQFNSSTDSTVVISSNSGNATTVAAMLERASVAVTSGTSDVAFISAFAGAQALRAVIIDTKTRRPLCTNMFAYCWALEEAPTFDLNGSLAITGMFSNCINLLSVPLYNTASVALFTNLFNSCAALQVVPEFNTANGTYFDSMFYGCKSLIECPDFVTTKAFEFSNMFFGCETMETAPNFNTKSAPSFINMFSGCTSLLAAPNYDLTNASNVTAMFNGCVALKTVPAYAYPVVTTATNLFTNCRAMTSFPDINMPFVNGIGSMFNACTSLEVGPNINAPNADNAASMFASCSSLRSIPAYSFPKVTNAAGFLSGANALVAIPEVNIATGTNVNAAAGSMISSLPNLRKCRTQNLMHGISFVGTQMPASEIQWMMDNVSWTTRAQTITITNAPGAVQYPVITKTGSGVTTNSNVVTVTSNTSLAVGMQVQANGLTHALITTDGTAKTIIKTAHGLVDGDVVSFLAAFTGVSGITLKRPYFVVNATADNFQISETLGGPVVQFTGSGSGAVYFNNVITAINGNSITLRYPAAVTNASLSLAFRALNTQIAVLKGWTVTG